MEGVGKVATVVVVTALSTIWSGYVLSILWGWFVVQTFGVPALTINTAIGLSIVVAYMAKNLDMNKGPEDFPTRLAKSVAIGVMKPAIGLFLGWIVYLCR